MKDATCFNTLQGVRGVTLKQQKAANRSFTHKAKIMETNEIRTTDTQAADNKLTTVIFPDKASAECAYNDLLEKGYAKNDINLLMSDTTHRRHFKDVHVEDSISTVLKDAVIGGAVGATIVGAAAAAVALIFPGFGLVVAGPLAAALLGVGAGGITGSIVGALEGAGIPEAHAKLYHERIEQGHIVVSFNPKSSEDLTYFENKWKVRLDNGLPYAGPAHPVAA